MKILAFSLLLVCTSALAQNIIRVRAVLVPNTGTFTATSEKTKGRLLKQGKEFSADRISVFVNSFNTENKLRDKHFREYIGGGAELPYPRVDISELKATSGKGQANLTVNGLTRPVKLTYEDKGKFIEGEFEVNSKDFNLPKAQYLGIGVEPVVKVSVKYFYETK